MVSMVGKIFEAASIEDGRLGPNLGGAAPDPPVLPGPGRSGVRTRVMGADTLTALRAPAPDPWHTSKGHVPEEAEDGGYVRGSAYYAGGQSSMTPIPPLSTPKSWGRGSLIRRAGLRCPNADLPRIDLLDECGLNRELLT